MKYTDPLALAILAASEALDPDHLGDCWPDPIAWDGRPLREQAKDLLALHDDYTTHTTAFVEAATKLRAALAEDTSKR